MIGLVAGEEGEEEGGEEGEKRLQGQHPMGPTKHPGNAEFAQFTIVLFRLPRLGGLDICNK